MVKRGSEGDDYRVVGGGIEEKTVNRTVVHHTFCLFQFFPNDSNVTIDCTDKKKTKMSEYIIVTCPHVT